VEALLARDVHRKRKPVTNDGELAVGDPQTGVELGVLLTDGMQREEKMDRPSWNSARRVFVTSSF
jgi:hypothetical protein